MSRSLPAIQLKPGREKSLLRRHPWVFSGAIAETSGEIENGGTVDILDLEGDFLARGAFSEHSQIRARIWSWEPDIEIDRSFFRERIQKAIGLRDFLHMQGRCDAYRLVHGESDGLPGLIVDRYADNLVLQSLSAGIERWRDTLVEILAELTGVETIFERSDADVRKLEGLPKRIGTLKGAPPPEKIAIDENGLAFYVDIQRGHKTGFYLDQRENRGKVRAISAGRKVLDCFSYTGGFGISALSGGAESVVAVESSKEAIGLGRQNLALNGFTPERIHWVEGDVFQTLRQFRDQGLSYDLIVLDPPKFAPTASQAQKAARGYKDINLLAFKLLNPDGILVTFSCSGGVSTDLFQKILASAALDAGVEAQIIEHLHQSTDHPVSLHFPEGAYLKGLVVRVLG